jgi:hypothetical protein
MGDRVENGDSRAASVVSQSERFNGDASPNLCSLNLSKFQEFRKRFERSKALERLERLERTDPRDERSAAIEPFDRTQGRLLERLEQAQAKIVLRFMNDSRATISSVDLDKQNQPAAHAGFSASAASITPLHAIATGEK